MKALRLLFVIGSAICLSTACENNQDLLNEEIQTDVTLQARTGKHVELPFKAKLHTSQADDALMVTCGEVISPTNFWGVEHQIGDGNATHLGNFTVDITFCFHLVLTDEGFPDFENGFGPYNDVDGYIEAANGDRLDFIGPGSTLVPTQEEGYVFEFQDICYFIGGTGKFENATGEFHVNSLVRADGTGTDHRWNGTIVLHNEL